MRKILAGEGLGRLDCGDRAKKPPVERHQRDRPGELAHVDVRKLAGIPDGLDWRIHGRGNAPTPARSSTRHRYLHSALDDRTRLVYSGIHPNDRAFTAVAFRQRVNTWFNSHDITVERVLSDNGSCYRSRLWRDTITEAGITPKFARDWHTDDERTIEHDHFTHFCNHHRAHGALGSSTPFDTLMDNVRVMHSWWMAAGKRLDVTILTGHDA